MNNRKRSISIANEPSFARIRSMPESTSAFVRAGQVIGSHLRAIEELVRNSILHGKCSNVTINMNKTQIGKNLGGVLLLEVSDDGLGLEEVAIRDFIGTKHCSSTGSFPSQSIASRGESLKAIADLCFEFRITSTYGILKTGDINDRSQTSSASLLTAPSKKKRRDYGSEISISHLDDAIKYSHFVTSEKIINDGTVVSFKSNIHQVLENDGSKTHTGTVVQLIGLFHRHHVRQKQYLRNSSELSTKGSDVADDGISSAKIKNCLQMLALAFPLVNFRFYPSSLPNPLPSVLGAREYIEWLTPTTETHSAGGQTVCHKDWWSLIKFRFRQLVGEKFSKDANVFKIDFVEDCENEALKEGYTNQSTLCYDEGTQWKVQGILYINPSHLECERCPRSRQYELIFVNHRLLRNSFMIADNIQSVCAKQYESQSWNGCLFSIYVTCPNKYIDLVIDDTKSFCCVRQSDRLLTCITRALTKALAESNSWSLETTNTAKLSTIRSNVNILEYRKTKDKDLKEPVDYGSKRIVSGNRLKRIGAVQDEIPQSSEGLNENTSSPFSRAFLESDQNSINIHKAHHVKKRESFGFIKSSESNISSMQWTRSRLRALDEDLKDLLGNQDSSYRGLKLTKSMMSSCQFIGQVDSKYILVQMDGIICAIDQHAADERIGLERLERLIESKIEGKPTPSVKLSKMDQSVDSSDLLKSVVLEPRQEIQLSSSQMSTVLGYENLLKKWYFDFDFVDRGQKLILKSVPGIYDKVSTAKDFIQFIQVLSNRTSDASCCKPAFFARALASLACRYAIMFGESLNTERCIEIIVSLTKCDFSFICAHGRPSIVPLLEMNDLDKNIFRSDVNRNTLPLRLRTPENDPYYGVQNRHIGSGNEIVGEAYF